VNLYEIVLTKVLLIYQYPFKILPEIDAGDVNLRQIIFKGCNRHLKSIYGECLVSGDSLYGLNKVDDIKSVKSNVEYKGKITSYLLEINKFANERTINQKELHNMDYFLKI